MRPTVFSPQSMMGTLILLIAQLVLVQHKIVSYIYIYIIYIDR